MNDLEPLITTLKNLKEKDTAIQLLSTLGKHASSYFEYDMIARCLFKIKEYELAIKYAEKMPFVSKTNEELYVARMNLINLYNHANYPEYAMNLIKMIELINPNDLDNKLEKAFSYFLLNEKDQAEKI